MTTAQQVCDWEKGWVGYRDNAGTKIWDMGPEPHWPGAAFCGKSQQVASWSNGMTSWPMSSWSRYVYCPNVVLDAMGKGARITSYQSHFMDLVLFDWAMSGGRRDGVADHIGRIISNNPALPYVWTIEFNTGDGSTNGARGCFVRKRYRADILCCVNMQSQYSSTPAKQAGPSSPAAVTPPADQDLNKWLDEPRRKALQAVLGVAQDGIIGQQTIKALEAALGTPQDGFFSGGFSTAVKVAQQRIGVAADGILGPKTGAALAAYLDAGHTFGVAHAAAAQAARTEVVSGAASAALPTLTTFPLPAGDFFGKDDGTARSHSGVRANDAVLVRRVQTELNAWCARHSWKTRIAVDGIYGDETARLISAYQGGSHVEVDGKVGPVTWKALGL